MIEKQRMVERDEKQKQEQAAQQAQVEQQMQQQQMQVRAQMEQARMEQEDKLNMRDNETKLLIANIQHTADDGIEEPEDSQEAKDKLEESIRQFNDKMKLEREKLAWEKTKNKNDNDVKMQIAKMRPKNTTNK